MSRLRAVEHGRTVLIAATSGISAVIAPDGRVVSVGEEDTAATLVEQVAMRDTLTVADRLGAWPEWAAALAALAACVAATTRRRRGIGSRTRSRRRRTRGDDRPPARSRPVRCCRGPGCDRRSPGRRVRRPRPDPRGDPDVRREGQRRVHRRPGARRRPRGSHPGGRRQLPRRDRRPRRPDRRARRPRPRPAPAGQGGPRRRLPRRLLLGARARVRRPRRDGRRRVPPARAAAAAARRPPPRRPGARLPLRAGRLGRELAQVPGVALPRGQHLHPAAAGVPVARHHRRLPGVPRLDAARHRPARRRQPGLRLPGRPRPPGAQGRADRRARSPSPSSSGSGGPAR